MGISELCIRRPVFTSLVTMTIIVFGIFAYRLLPVAALPAVDFPTITINASLSGASPETMAASVAAVIERELSSISGIRSITSQSTLGRTRITVQFDLERDIDGAALDVQSALSIANRRMPPEMTTPPGFRKVNPGDFAILVISLVSNTLPLSTVDEYAQTVLAQQISQLPGVAQVDVNGSQKFAVRVQVDPIAAAARNISLDEIRRVVIQTNSSSPVGTLFGDKQNVTLVATGAMRRAEEYKRVVVAYRNGAPVMLSEVARVVDAVENDKVATWFNNDRAIVLGIQKQPGANTIAVVDAIRERLPQFRAQVPAAIKLEILNDRSISIRESVHDVQITLAIAVSLVILVIFLFLRSVSATIIPGLAVPVSLIGTCAMMYALGFSINNMTLLALTLSVGFVVDDAIVMLENIVRHIENGMQPFEAALKGSREIGFTIVSITFALIAVFIPVLLMGGMVGRIFREFAVTVAVAIFLSAFVSLTLTPMLCARVLRHHSPDEKHNFILVAFEALFKKAARGYESSLDWVLRYKPIILVVTVVTLAATMFLFTAIPKGFFPDEDTGFLSGSTEGNSDVAFPAMVELQKEIAQIVMKDPAVDTVQSTVGPNAANAAANSGRMFIKLKPRTERTETSTEVIQRLRQSIRVVAGIKATFQNVKNLNITGRPSKSEYQYTLQSSDTDLLYKMAPEMAEKIAKIDGLLDVETDLSVKNPQMSVEIDRERAAIYGVTVEQIRQEMFNAFGTRTVATIFTSNADYPIILETLPEFQTDTGALSRIHIKTSSGTSVPLEAVTRITPTVGPLLVNHQASQPSVTISFNLRPGHSLGAARDSILEIQRESNLPANISVGFQGTAQVFEDSQKGQVVLVLAAIFAAYVLLGVLYESFIHPVVIISGLPSAGVGALLTLVLFRMDLSVIAMIGIVMLVGIVMKNAIMMLDFAIVRRKIGLSAEAAIREAALLRFRPIMMTTFSAIFGTLPIALGAGAGAELRQPLGIAVVGGLCFSQLLTLYITPVIYCYLDGFDRMLKRRLDPPKEEDLPVEVEPEHRPVAAE
jgi:HAE1 family hydrophobic/amphiphilic exporter-1